MIILSTLLTIGLTVLAIVAITGILFYFMYHTFHGDLPSIMKLIIVVGIIVATTFIIFGVIL